MNVIIADVVEPTVYRYGEGYIPLSSGERRRLTLDQRARSQYFRRYDHFIEPAEDCSVILLKVFTDYQDFDNTIDE